jgi:hypothetical protein
MMGFSELTAIIAEKVAQNDEKLFQNAEEISGYLRPKNDPVQATHLNEKIITQFTLQAQHNFDQENGGFSKSPKFPHVSTLETLMTLDQLHHDDTLTTMLIHTLDSMALGGMYDLIDGGFCRYSTDELWLVPHFEKMTYDNALLCALYAQAGIVYKNTNYLKIAEETARFMIRFMMEENLFYSASDADSEGEEGKYFVYTYEEIVLALQHSGVENPHDAAKSIGASPEGNFEGHCIIRLSSLERPEWFEPVKKSLAALRRSRTYPFIDRKVITAWNTMMIRALFILGKHNREFKDQALRSLDALLSSMDKNGSLQHSALIHKTPKIDAFLEDYAYLCVTLIETYEITLDEAYLVEAQRFANKALELFYEEGKWYFSRGAFQTVGELDDGTYPSAMAMMVDALLSLGILVDPKYRRFAFKSLEYNSVKLMKTPVYYPKLTQQTIRYLRGDRLIKSNSDTLFKLQESSYPFTYLRNDESMDEIIICGEASCFASTQDPTKVNDLILTTL